MKKSISILFATAILSGCTTPKLTNTVWQTISLVSNGTEQGLLVSSMYFQKDGNINFYNAVIADSSLVIAPYKFAEGRYKVDGSLSKDASISINASTIQNDSLTYTGLINVKKNSMLLTMPDSTALFYSKNNNIIIK